jgi:hypothetical protein
LSYSVKVTYERSGKVTENRRRRGSSSSSSSSPIVVETADELLTATVAGDAVQVWRYDVQAGAWKYLAPFDPTALEALGVTEFTRQRFGGGKFKARIRHRGGTFGMSRVFDVDGPGKVPEDAAPPAAASSSSSASQPPRWVEQILFPIGVTFATALGGYLAKKLLETPAPDPILLQLDNQLGAGAGAAVALDPLELQRAIAEAEQRGEQRGRELGELRAQVDNPPKGNDGGGVMGAIDRGLPQVVGLLKQKLEMDERRLLQPAPVAVDAIAATAADDAAAAGDPIVGLLLGVPKMGRRFLLSGAEGDEPPEIYAGLVIGKLDDVTYARMPVLLARADFVDVFVATWPEFADHREWVEQLAGAMRATLDASTAADDAGAGDATEAAKNAAP